MNNNTSAATTVKSPFHISQVLLLAGISLGYLLLSYLLIGFKPEQLFLVTVFNLLYFASSVTRKFIIGFSVFIVYWIIFDYMKAFPNYQFQQVHIASLYNMEKEVFGIYFNGDFITPNEYWLQKGNAFLDIMSGIFYLTWVPVPLLFAGYLFFKNKQQFLYFAFTFLLVNLLGFVVYYLYPAAPPWYVQAHGFLFDPHTRGNTAGLAKFDAYFHVSVFKSLYEKSSNVFAAMPSLHSSYPVIVFYYGLKNKLGVINVLFGIIMAGIWFSAVYTSHHYVLDVFAGIGCAIVGFALFGLLLKNKSVAKFFTKMVLLIS